tara:strand:+ start:2449 stop:2589 length:141 start_codon:yes stop_codon:yes gene_type:complete
MEKIMILKNKIQTALGDYYDKHIEPRILSQMTLEQKESFELDYPFE